MAFSQNTKNKDKGMHFFSFAKKIQYKKRMTHLRVALYGLWKKRQWQNYWSEGFICKRTLLQYNKMCNTVAIYYMKVQNIKTEKPQKNKI